MYDIINAFYNCKKIGWIKNEGHGFNSVGRTFEKMVGIKENSSPLADINGFEIKAKCSKIHSNITLFSCSPFNYSDVDCFRSTLGKPDETIRESKVLFLSVWNKESILINEEWLLKLVIDENFGIISIKVYNKYTNEFVTEVIWLFEQLEHRINEKCKNLVFIEADRGIKDNQIFFKYNNLSFYEIKSISTFYRLIKDGIISITFNIGVYKSGKNFGKPYNHGINFCIREKDINLLYNKILNIN